MLALAVPLAVLALAAPAWATFSESYGGGAICGSNCFVQSANAHTFVLNEGFGLEGSPALACQLFNHENANEVSHGSGYCQVFYFGGAFVWARVYNQSGATYRVSGFAET
jgi:hypothetical protein